MGKSKWLVERLLSKKRAKQTQKRKNSEVVSRSEHHSSDDIHKCSHRNWFHISAGLFVFLLHLATQTAAMAAKTGVTESLRSKSRYFYVKGLWSKTKSSLS